MKTAAIFSALLAVASALPGQPRLSRSSADMWNIARRQTQGTQQMMGGLQDVDILQFALTLEWLETSFYQQGFAKFGDDQFAALGLSAAQIADLKSVGKSEQAHVVFLQSAIAGAGVQPVQPCQYSFGFTDAKSMVATALVLENIGVSAYLGAASLVSSPKILTAAGSILTVEARHQSFIRAATGSPAIPQPFDTPLGPKAVFSLAAPFIASCPQGSNLALSAFPALSLSSPPAVGAFAAGSMVQVKSDAAASAKFCAFTNAGQGGGTAFTPFAQGTGCPAPPNLGGIAYLTLTSAAPNDGVITDAIIVAGPQAIPIS